MVKVFRAFLVVLASFNVLAPGSTASAQIAGTPVSLVEPPPGRNTVAYDPYNQVYLVIEYGHPIHGRFYSKHGSPVSGRIVIAHDDPSPFTGWPGVTFGGTSSDPTFLVTYTAFEDTHRKYGRLVRYAGGSPQISSRRLITAVGDQWYASERAQAVWNGEKFIVGTRVDVSGANLPQPFVHFFDLSGNVSGGLNLGDSLDWYGSPALACSTNLVCLITGFASGYPFGGLGGSYARLFDGRTLQPLSNMFYLDDHSSRMEDQNVVFMTHTGQFLTAWWRAGGADIRVVNTDGGMGPTHSTGAPYAGDIVLSYNAVRQRTLLVTKQLPADLYALELGSDGIPVNPSNAVLVATWDGRWPEYQPGVAANNTDGQWLVVTRQTAGGIAALVHDAGDTGGGDPAPPPPPSSPATFTAPAPGATVAPPVTFQWTPRDGASAYYLYVGTSQGAKDVVDTGEIGATSYTASSLPGGRTLYATIWTKQNGVWGFSELTFSTVAAAATFIYPTNGATNISLSTPFQWTGVAGADAYYLYVGTSQGAKNLVDTGEIGNTSYAVPDLPAGQTLWARIWTKQAGVWRFNDVSFTVAAAAKPASLLNPSSGASFDPAHAFRWNPVSGAQAYYLYVGTSPGAKDVIDTGEIRTAGYLAEQALPARRTLHARLHTKVNGTWLSVDSSFSISGASLIHPMNGATNVDLGFPFRWTPIQNAQAYYLYVGTSPGAKDLVDTGEIRTTVLPLTGLPAGIPLFATIWTKVDGVWTSRTTSFTAAPLDMGPPLPLATMIEPATGVQSFNSAKNFRWTSVAGAQRYYLYVGSSMGAKDIVDTGETVSLAYQTPALPTGQALWARIWTRMAGVWHSTDAVFESSGAALINPVQGGTITRNHAFRWTPVSNADAYYLYVGTSPGAKDLVDTAEIGRTWHYAPNLPTGVTLYATLWTKANGIWRFQQVAFTVTP